MRVYETKKQHKKGGRVPKIKKNILLRYHNLDRYLYYDFLNK